MFERAGMHQVGEGGISTPSPSKPVRILPPQAQNPLEEDRTLKGAGMFLSLQLEQRD